MAKDPFTGAMTSRIKTVYNVPELSLFFITGQPTGTQRFDGLGERHASIAAMPYNTLSEGQRLILPQNRKMLRKAGSIFSSTQKQETLNFMTALPT
ncbi:MAG: hypothetical protein JWO78_2085 [Micavibrio sp.]|nr:hypothetical protein [Micavibrio sp.]